MKFVAEYSQLLYFLNYSPTHAPTTKQRGMTKDAMLSSRFSEFKAMALITDSTFTRGAITAFNWIFKPKMEIKTFAARDHRGGADWLAELSGTSGESIDHELLRLIQYAGVPLPP